MDIDKENVLPTILNDSLEVVDNQGDLGMMLAENIEYDSMGRPINPDIET